MAMIYAGICCRDFKYHYCHTRPYQVDSNITTHTGKPNFPSYTSGHSAFPTSTAEVLSYMFPGGKNEIQAMAEGASISRPYGGIHYRFDIENSIETVIKIGGLAV
jgi:hypothetical protein